MLLSYSTNVHPGESLADLRRIVAEDVTAVRLALADDFPVNEFGLELRLGRAAIRELADLDALEALKGFLRANGFFLFSINGFPLGNFHDPIVKDRVYRPDWGEAERQELTVSLCRILAHLLPVGVTGSISTSPGSYKPWGDHRALRRELARGFAPVVRELDAIRRERDQLILLAIEPEPFCTVETTPELIEFIRSEMAGATVERLVDEFGYAEADACAALRRHVGINLDACHLAVEFEDPATAIRQLVEAEIPIAKLHASAAARVVNPADNRMGMNRLRRLDEPKYLHQTFAVDRAGKIAFRAPDLGEFLALPQDELARFAEVRTHFHMPLFAPVDSELGATADMTAQLLRLAVSGELTGQIVAETYTWPLLADRDLHRNIADELRWILRILGDSDCK